MNKLLLYSPLFLPILLNAQFGEIDKLILSSPDHKLENMLPADLDGDGDQDVIAKTNFGVYWFENRTGNADFSPAIEVFRTEPEPDNLNLKMRAIDLDGDGIVDFSSVKSWAKMLGNGDFEVFENVFEKPVLAFADIDNDGLKDALVGDGWFDKTYWQKNLGGGNFDMAELLIDQNNLEILEAGDFDHDGPEDLLLFVNNNIFLYKNKGNLEFELTAEITGTTQERAYIFDSDKDGKNNLFLKQGKTIVNYQYDNGNFEIVQLITSKALRDFGFGDVNSDGNLDLIISRYDFNSAPLKYAYWFEGDAKGVFNTPKQIRNSGNIDFTFSGIDDFNNDNRSDVLFNPGALFLNMGDEDFSSKISFVKFLGDLNEIAAKDLDADGQEDIILWTDNGVVALKNLGNEAFSPPIYLGTDAYFFEDLNGDGLQDAVFVESEVFWSANRGNFQFDNPIKIPGLVAIAESVNGADVDGDGDFDLFAACGTQSITENARAYWFENDGTGNFIPHQIEDGIESVKFMNAEDVNLDGKLDLIIFKYNDEIRWCENIGTAGFAPSAELTDSNLASPNDVTRREFLDIDEDGDKDLLVSDFGWNRQEITIQKNSGRLDKLLYTNPQTLMVSSSQGNYGLSYLHLNDFTGDGNQDILGSFTRFDELFFRENLGNSFGPVQKIYEPEDRTNIQEITAIDIDKDGIPNPVFLINDDENSWHEVRWLTGEKAPPPPPEPFTVFNDSVRCDNNGTPLDATDDRIILTFTVAGGHNLADSFAVSSSFPHGIMPDTARYDEPTEFVFRPGSAGGNEDGMTVRIKNLSWPYRTQTYNFSNPGNCSPDAPPAISLRDVSLIYCQTNWTATDSTDDFLVFVINADPHNTPLTDSFTVESNFGQGVSHFDTLRTVFNYDWYRYIRLGAGSALSDTIEFTIRDHQNPDLFATYFFKSPGACSDFVSTGNFKKETTLSVYPNPFEDEVFFEFKNDNSCSDCRLEIFDFLGRKVSSMPFKNSVIFQSQNKERVLFYFLKNSAGKLLNSGKIFSVK